MFRSYSTVYGSFQGGAPPVLDTTPVWQSPDAGSLGNANGSSSYSLQFTAASPGGNALTYTIATGSLPPGLTLSAAGLLSGTVTNPSVNTTYSFRVQVSDGTVSAVRDFSLTAVHVDAADPFNAYVVGLWHLDSDYADASFQRNIVATNPNTNAQVQTGTSKFGTGSLYFNGSLGSPADIRIPAGEALYAGTKDWCLEFWMKATTPQQFGAMMETAGAPAGTATTTRVVGAVDIYNWAGAVAANHAPPTQNGGTRLCAQFYDGTNYSTLYSTSNPNDNQWHHVAYVRSGNTTYLYFDGQMQDSVAIGAGVNIDFGRAHGFKLGSWINNDAGNYYYGYFDDMRLTIGAARYTANFTPATQAFAYP